MLRRPAITHADHRPLKGVNLGGWLVLEKWITPSLFAGLHATDEYTLCKNASPQVISMLRRHRASFIIEADFKWLAKQGVDAVRLPVGYGVFGDMEPYLGTVEYVDKVFTWARKYKLKVLLDLHAAPGSQNGWDHSGRAGEVGWHKRQTNIAVTLGVVKRLAARYGKNSQLLGIELLNEPKWTVPKGALKTYYEAAYSIIRDICGPKVWVVFSDGFRPRRWQKSLRGKAYENVFIDTHRYQCFSQKDKRHDITWHLRKALKSVPRSLQKISKFHPVIVGEWSLALDRASTGKLNPEQITALNRSYAAAQLLAYSHVQAWFFWTYKTENSPSWSYRDSVERGWLPSWK